MVTKRKDYFLLILVPMLVAGLASCKGKATREEIGNNGIVKITSGQSHYAEDYEEAARLMQRGKSAGAISIFKKLCDIEDESQKSNAFLGLGSAYLETGDYQNAIKSYNSSIKLNNKNAEAYVGLGSSYASLNDNVNAIKFYNFAKQIDVNNSNSYWGLSMAYDAMNATDSAKINARKFLELEPNSKYRSYMQAILNH